MKILFILLMLVYSTAYSATAEYKRGEYVDQYKIIDVGGPYNNHVVWIAAQVTEVTIQLSSVNTHTFSESLLCWDDPDITECPDDDLGGGVFRMPVLKQLNDIMVANNVVPVGFLTVLGEKSVYLAFWNEYKLKKLITDSLAQMVLDGYNDLQKVRSLRFVFVGNGIDPAVALTLAQARVNQSIIHTYDELGLATIPLPDRRLLKLFGEVGWFE